MEASWCASMFARRIAHRGERGPPLPGLRDSSPPTDRETSNVMYRYSDNISVSSTLQLRTLRPTDGVTKDTSTIEPPFRLTQVLTVPVFKIDRPIDTAHSHTARPLALVTLSPYSLDLALRSSSTTAGPGEPSCTSMVTSSSRASRFCMGPFGE